MAFTQQNESSSADIVGLEKILATMWEVTQDWYRDDFPPNVPTAGKSVTGRDILIAAVGEEEVQGLPEFVQDGLLVDYLKSIPLERRIANYVTNLHGLHKKLGIAMLMEKIPFNDSVYKENKKYTVENIQKMIDGEMKKFDLARTKGNLAIAESKARQTSVLEQLAVEMPVVENHIKADGLIRALVAPVAEVITAAIRLSRLDREKNKKPSSSLSVDPFFMNALNDPEKVADIERILEALKVRSKPLNSEEDKFFTLQDCKDDIAEITATGSFALGYILHLYEEWSMSPGRAPDGLKLVYPLATAEEYRNSILDYKLERCAISPTLATKVSVALKVLHNLTGLDDDDDDDSDNEEQEDGDDSPAQSNCGDSDAEDDQPDKDDDNESNYDSDDDDDDDVHEFAHAGDLGCNEIVFQFK